MPPQAPKAVTVDLPSVLKALETKSGKSLKVTTFDNRLRIQKALYLLKVKGHASARHYNFSLYVHGPYSPDLAKDYYAIQDGKQPPRVPFSPGPQESDAEDLVARAIQKGNEFLEAAATLHKVRVANPGSSAEEVKSQVAHMKPHVADRIEEAWTYLVSNRFVAAAT